MCRERGKEELLFHRDRVSIADNKKDLEEDSGDGSTILWMYLMALKQTPKNGENDEKT